MMESFRIYQITRAGDGYDFRPVDAIPPDTVCTVYIGGNGVVDEDRMLRLGVILDREVFCDVGDIPNYVVMYDHLTVADNRPERLIEIDKNGNDVLPRTHISATVYLNEKNIDVAYRRKVLPLLLNNGTPGIMRIQFAIDGDSEEIISRLFDKVRRTMEILNFSQDSIRGTLNIMLQNCAPYSDFTPPYTTELFEKILLPRISDENGRRLDMETALRNVRKMNILAHCHGAHVVRVMERIMQDTMMKIGYTQSQISQIMQQVLVASYAPSCALGDSKFQFVSFMSVYDYVVDVPNNWVYQYVSDNRIAEANLFSNGVRDWQWNFAPIFLKGRNGNAFVVKQRFKGLNPVERIENAQKRYKNVNVPVSVDRLEHISVRYFPDGATEDGELLAMLARNVIMNGIKNSLNQGDGFTPLPPMQELVCDGENDEALKNLLGLMTAAGDKFMGDVSEYAHEHNQEIHPPFDIISYAKLSNLKR